LETFNPELMYKKRVICFSKSDSIDEEKIASLKRLRIDTRAEKPMFISAITNMNIQELKYKVWELLKEFQAGEI
jgi:GTP-binding protein